MPPATYDPEKFVVSTFRALRDFTLANCPAYPEDYSDSELAGQSVYDVVSEFPSAGTINKVGLKRGIIHFEIDDINPITIGMGENKLTETREEDVPVDPDDIDAGVKTVITPREAKCHDFNFDVGVWTSDESGGVTARLEITQLLNDLFVGAGARAKINADTEGLQIRSFSGGRNIEDTINDITVYRTVGAELVIRVFSLAPLVTESSEVEVEEITLHPNLDVAIAHHVE